MKSENGELVINFFGPPNAGKTVAATSMFAKLKRAHVDVVLISEFAHQMVVEEHQIALNNQLYIWASQQFRIFAGCYHARVVVTDSPILLGYVYNTGNIPLQELILAEHRKYTNFNIVLDLAEFPYSMVGRIHDRAASVTIGNDIVKMMGKYDIPFLSYSDYIEEEIVEIILSTLE